MSVFHEAQSTTDAWLATSEFLRANGDAVGLHVAISSPMESDANVIKALDDRLAAAGAITCKHVAATIFPEALWRGAAHHDPTRLFDLYNRAGGYFERLRARRRRAGHGDWGTYFQRLSAANYGRNGRCQLAHALDALSRTSKPKGAIHLHTSLPSDGFRVRGGPCLQLLTLHVERRNNSNGVSACAIYRNHDFFEKALGNYIGLGQLLEFIAEAASLEVGTLHVISGHAFLSQKGPIVKVLDAFGV